MNLETQQAFRTMTTGIESIYLNASMKSLSGNYRALIKVPMHRITSGFQILSMKWLDELKMMGKLKLLDFDGIISIFTNLRLLTHNLEVGLYTIWSDMKILKPNKVILG